MNLLKLEKMLTKFVHKFIQYKYNNNLKRLAYTDRDVTRLLKKMTTNVNTRYSSYDPNANKIIQEVRDKKYQGIIKLSKYTDINGHDKSENTPLTDAALRGDNDGVKFLITEMGANIYASCDCPHNKTALHYASEYGHKDTVELLLKLGANPNTVDSRKYTALDIAKNDEIRNVLIKNGGFNGNKLPKVSLLVPRKGSCNLLE